MKSATFRIGFGIALACFFTIGTGQPVEGPDPVIDRMAKVNVFAFGGVGITGAISPGEKDFRLILSRPSAETDFERLLRVGNLQAKCYALVGLWKLNPERFKAQAASWRSSQDEVSTMRGCLMWRETIAAIVERIQANSYADNAR